MMARGGGRTVSFAFCFCFVVLFQFAFVCKNPPNACPPLAPRGDPGGPVVPERAEVGGDKTAPDHRGRRHHLRRGRHPGRQHSHRRRWAPGRPLGVPGGLVLPAVGACGGVRNLKTFRPGACELMGSPLQEDCVLLGAGVDGTRQRQAHFSGKASQPVSSLLGRISQGTHPTPQRTCRMARAMPQSSEGTRGQDLLGAGANLPFRMRRSLQRCRAPRDTAGRGARPPGRWPPEGEGWVAGPVVPRRRAAPGPPPRPPSGAPSGSPAPSRRASLPPGRGPGHRPAAEKATIGHWGWLRESACAPLELQTFFHLPKSESIEFS